MYSQLTLMPLLDGHVTINKTALNDPAVMLTLTALHDRNYQAPPDRDWETSINDKLVQYTFEFNYANSKIQNVR